MQPPIPPYTSCIFFELYENHEENYVQIFLKNSTSTNVPALKIPNCGIRCPLNKLYEIFDDILPEQDFDDGCRLRDGETPVGNPEGTKLEYQPKTWEISLWI